jgi:hypothetical protein
MKKSIMASLLIASITVSSKSTLTTNIFGDETKCVETAISERDETVFLTKSLINEIGKMEHADMMSGNGPDEITTKVVYFVAPGWDHQSAFAQISYKRGGVTETSLVFFTPDNEGYLSADQMGMCPVAEHPCSVCILDNIEVTGEKIWVKFVDRDDATKVQKFEMGTNFEEMSIWWEN